MSLMALFVVGFAITLIVGAAVALLIYAAVLDGRRQRELSQAATARVIAFDALFSDSAAVHAHNSGPLGAG